MKWAGTVCLARENERQRIPEKGLPDTHKRLELPQLNEGFDELYYVIINDAQDCIIQEWNHEI